MLNILVNEVDRHDDVSSATTTTCPVKGSNTSYNYGYHNFLINTFLSGTHNNDLIDEVLETNYSNMFGKKIQQRRVDRTNETSTQVGIKRVSFASAHNNTDVPLVKTHIVSNLRLTLSEKERQEVWYTAQELVDFAVQQQDPADTTAISRKRIESSSKGIMIDTPTIKVMKTMNHQHTQIRKPTKLRSKKTTKQTRHNHRTNTNTRVSSSSSSSFCQRGKQQHSSFKTINSWSVLFK